MFTQLIHNLVSDIPRNLYSLDPKIYNISFHTWSIIILIINEARPAIYTLPIKFLIWTQ